MISVLVGLVAATLSVAPVWGEETAGPASMLSPLEEEKLFCNVCRVLRPGELPAGVSLFEGHEPTARCGTGPVLEALHNWGRISAETRTKLTTFFQRPSSQRTHPSPSGRFLIHYDVSGTHAVSTEDNDSNGVPDYVDETAAVFDHSWDREIGELGYLPPPEDSDGIYDIHIQQLGLQGVYGLTFPTGSTTSSSYIQIDNDFTDNIYQTRGLDGLRVTAAHEFFHAIQFAYYAPFDAAWWQELTATWMEDVIYDDINDYYQYQTFFFQDPGTSLDDSPFVGLQPFAASVFAHHLEQVYGINTIRDTWESLGTRTPSTYEIEDIDTALPKGLSSILPRFIVWNYLTGNRHVAGYYEEGASYTEISPRQITPTSGGTISGSVNIDHLSSAYLAIKTSSVSGGLRVSLSLESGSTYEVVMMLFQGGSPEVVTLAGSETTIANVSRYDEVVVVPISTATSGSRFRIDYSISAGSSITVTSDLVGDFDADGSVAFTDFLAFAGSFGQPAREDSHNRQHDLNADGTVGFGDFLLFASHFGESR